jgi:Ca-activated chloride channel homolog
VVPIGTVFAGQQRELLVRAHLDDARMGTKVLASVRLHFRDPAEDGLQRVQEAVLRATVTDDPSLVAAHKNSRTQTLLAMREAAMVAQLASQQANAGELERAEAQLAQAEQRLQAQAAVAATREEKDMVLRSAERISQTRSSMAKAKKAAPAARASAGRKAALDLNDGAMDAFGY